MLRCASCLQKPTTCYQRMSVKALSNSVDHPCLINFNLAVLPRKQLYPLGMGNFPTLVQKHFNGAEPWFTMCVNGATLQLLMLPSIFTSVIPRKQEYWQFGWKVFVLQLLRRTLEMFMLRFLAIRFVRGVSTKKRGWLCAMLWKRLGICRAEAQGSCFCQLGGNAKMHGQ